MGTNTRAIVGAAALACLAGTADAQTGYWIGDWSNNWFQPENWNSGVVPGPTFGVIIGDMGATNEFAVINSDETIAGLDIINDSVLVVESGSLLVNGQTHVIGGASQLRVHSGPLERFRATYLDVEDGLIRVAYDSVLEVQNLFDLNTGSHLVGQGEIELTGTGLTFDGSGAVYPFVNDSPGFLNFHSDDPNSAIDLDGFSGTGFYGLNGFNDASQHGAEIRFFAPEVTDTFDGAINMTSASMFWVSVPTGWRSGPSSQIDATYSQYANTIRPSRIRGPLFNLAGGIRSHGVEAQLDVLSETLVIEATTHALAEDGGLLRLGAQPITSQTTIEGGLFTADTGGEIHFDSDQTRVYGGTFVTPSSSSADGAIRFTGPSSWYGDAVFNGFASVEDTATVSGISTINADRIDLDGPSNDTVWNIGNSMQIYADSIDSVGGNTFRGDLNISGGFLSALRMETGTGFWTSHGNIELGGGALNITRLTGDKLSLFGSMTVPSGAARVMSNVSFFSSSSINLPSENSYLTLAGETELSGAMTVTGLGTIATSGQMQISDGMEMGSVRLVNDGVLRIGVDSFGATGLVRAASFEDRADATTVFSLRGDRPGDEFDRIETTGPIVLSGAIEVELLDIGGIYYEPVPGDQFAIMSTDDVVSGSFIENPVTEAGGKVYNWNVSLARANTEVVLTLQSVSCGVADLTSTGATIPGFKGYGTPDGVVDLDDLGYFLNLWLALDPAADLTTTGATLPGAANFGVPDGMVDLDDLGFFLNAWLNGCV